MRRIFADTNYWVALLSPQDQLHIRAKQISKLLSNTRVVTSEWILTELLNKFAASGEDLRIAGALTAADLRADPAVDVVPFTSESFGEALELYRNRADKRWSLTDCSSILIMRRQGIDSALTYDRHFQQAGFRALLRE